MRYCGRCGAPLPQRCRRCGFENPPANKFCGWCAAALDRPADGNASAPTGELKRVTVLFCDIVGSMLLTERLGAEAMRDLAPWERVKRFAVLARPFSVAADELTVSLKLRRNVIFQHYKEELEALYRE